MPASAPPWVPFVDVSVFEALVALCLQAASILPHVGFNLLLVGGPFIEVCAFPSSSVFSLSLSLGAWACSLFVLPLQMSITLTFPIEQWSITRFIFICFDAYLCS